MNTQLDLIMRSAKSDNTWLAYKKGWRKFKEFCDRKGYQALPATPETIIEFMMIHATEPVGRNGRPLKMNTIALYLSAINHQHIDSGFVSPTSSPEVKQALCGLKRTCDTAVRKVEALREYDIEKMIDACDDTLIGKRDAAIISIAYSGGFRRSEICDIRFEDIEILKKRNSKSKKRKAKTPTKMFIHIRKSKTDQEGNGYKIPIIEGKRIKPITHLLEWLRASGIKSGYIFRSMGKGKKVRDNQLHAQNIPRLVKYYAEKIGLDPTKVSGHSLRAGFVTSAVVHGAPYHKIMEITRHKNPAILLRYVRDRHAFKRHAGKRFI